MRLEYRPLAVTGFTVLAVLFVSIFVDSRAAMLCVAGGLFLIILSLAIGRLRKRMFTFFLAGALIVGGLLFTLENDFTLNEAIDYTKRDISSVTGIVKDFPTYSDSRYYYLIEADSVDGESVDFTMRYSSPSELDAEPYDKFSANVHLYVLGKSVSEDIELYFRSNGVYLGAYEKGESGSSVVIEAATEKPFFYNILKLRKEIQHRILDKLPNEYGGTAVALLIGDKSFLSEQTKTNITEVGLAPVFAVSGLHISVWIMGAYAVLGILKLKRRTRSAISIVLTLFFMALTGFSPSVCRSGLMMIIFLGGNLFRRRSDSLNSLGFAALVMCCINPFIAANVGFLMSFSATLGIVTLMPILEEKIVSKIPTKLLKLIAEALLVSVTAILGSLPITVLFIEHISVFSLLSNLLVTYAAMICMIFSGFAAILFPIGFVSDFLFLIAGLSARYILAVANVFAQAPVTTLSTASLFWKASVIVSLCVVAFSLALFRGKAVFKASCVGVSAAVIIASLGSYFYYDGLTQVYLPYVGNGISVIIESGKEKYLINGANNDYYSFNTVSDILDRISRSDTNLLLVPDSTSLNSIGTLRLIRDKSYKKIIMPETDLTASTIANSDITVSEEAQIRLTDSSNIFFNSEENNSYAYCHLDGISFLVLFDTVKRSDIEERHRTADFLVCGTYIPECIDPSDFNDVFVCATEKKSKSICEYVEKCGGRAISTCKTGDISVKIRNEEYKIYAQEEG